MFSYPTIFVLITKAVVSVASLVQLVGEELKLGLGGFHVINIRYNIDNKTLNT